LHAAWLETGLKLSPSFFSDRPRKNINIKNAPVLMARWAENATTQHNPAHGLLPRCRPLTISIVDHNPMMCKELQRKNMGAITGLKTLTSFSRV
jgi:hypothetical protein